MSKNKACLWHEHIPKPWAATIKGRRPPPFRASNDDRRSSEAWRTCSSTLHSSWKEKEQWNVCVHQIYYVWDLRFYQAWISIFRAAALYIFGLCISATQQQYMHHHGTTLGHIFHHDRPWGHHNWFVWHSHIHTQGMCIFMSWYFSFKKLQDVFSFFRQKEALYWLTDWLEWHWAAAGK